MKKPGPSVGISLISFQVSRSSTEINPLLTLGVANTHLPSRFQ